MRIGDFEVRVKPQNREPFYEVQDPQDGSVYVVACPGSLFEIQVSASPHLLRGGRIFRVRCDVDGKGVGSHKLLKQRHPQLAFVGFLKEGDSRITTYDRFKFAAAVPGENTTTAESLDFKEGRILITFSEVVCKGTTKKSYQKARDIKLEGSAKVPSLPEGKKFFLAPSLTTATDGSHTGGGFSTKIYSTVSQITFFGINNLSSVLDSWMIIKLVFNFKILVQLSTGATKYCCFQLALRNSNYASITQRFKA